MIGIIKAGESKSFDDGLVDAISVRESKYRLRGHYSNLYRIVFLSSGKEVGRTTRLSAADIEILLNGPFKQFDR